MDSPQRQNRSIIGIAIALIAVGAFFLFVEIFDIRLGVDWWPLVFLIPGLALIGIAFSGRIANAGLAVTGANIAVLGAIFMFQSATGNWESWTYIWTLFPVGTGLVLIAAGNRNDDETTVRSGVETARWGAIAFLIGVVVFEVFLFSGLIGYIIPIALIAIGGFILWNNTRDNGGLAGMFGNGPTPPPAGGPMPPPGPVPSPFAGPSAPGPAPYAPTPRPSGSTCSPPPAPVAPAQASAVTRPVEPPIITPPPVQPPVHEVELSAEPFPADEMPESPTADGDPFPADEEADGVPPATRPRNRRRPV